MLVAMTLRTPFTEFFSLRHPIALAPMGGSAGGALAAAVSNGGGLGLVGGGRGDPGWLDRELPIVAAGTGGPWGVGFLSWAVDVGAVEQALAHHPSAVMLAFGDPRPLLEPIRGSGAALIIQVTDLDEARQALDAGADVIVAQGTEAGGHGGRRGRSTLSFVPVVADLAAPTPVLAAGGIADGRGVAAALVLGAAGALIGTRFQATPEALADPAITKAIIEGGGEDTERSTVLDIARGAPWPSKYPARTLRHPFLERWRGREDELAADADAPRAYQEAVARGDLPPVPVWASEAIDLITDLRPAAELVGALAAQAEKAMAPSGTYPAIRRSPLDG
jgi:nitronate monooxygenase